MRSAAGRATLLGCAGALTLLLAVPQPCGAQQLLRVKGSDTLGARLGPPAERAFRAQHPELEIEWEGLGSNTAFTGLLDGSADLGVSSRPIRPEELELAQRLGIAFEETLIGFDALAVIVHPSNPLESISLEQLAKLFTGRIQHWTELTGSNLAVNPVSLPSYSAAHERLRDGIITATFGEPIPFAETTRFIEDGANVVEHVAGNSRAIACVSAAFARGRPVRVLPLAAAGQSPMLPTPQSIQDGSYPLTRELYAYVRRGASAPAHELTAFLLTGANDAWRRSGLLRRDLPPAERPGVAEPSPIPGSLEPATRILFQSRSTRLGTLDRERLDALLEPLRSGTHTAWVAGHADGLYPRPNNPEYAQRRAEAVASYLRGQGVPDEHIEVTQFAESRPLASNEDAATRHLNRRVDVRLLLRGS